MEENKLKLPKMQFSSLILAIALGVVVAVGLYQIKTRGLFPSNIKLPEPKETRTVVQEENAVISAVEKSSP